MSLKERATPSSVCRRGARIPIGVIENHLLFQSYRLLDIAWFFTEASYNLVLFLGTIYTDVHMFYPLDSVMLQTNLFCCHSPT